MSNTYVSLGTIYKAREKRREEGDFQKTIKVFGEEYLTKNAMFANKL